MVVISLELLARCVNQGKRRKEESLQRFLRRITHIYLNNRHVHQIANLDDCSSLKVLYLYENDIERIENLSFASGLANLYLSKNRIQRIENLTSLVELSKLYLGHNEIAVVEGLQDLPELRELHIEFQRLEAGEQLIFDPICISQMAHTLTVLNVSGNGLHTLEPLAVLQELKLLLATHNRLKSLKELLRVLRCWPRMERLDLSQNPVCNRSKYLDHVVVTAPKLAKLDGKEISPSLRDFVQAWKHAKDQRRAEREMVEQQGAQGHVSFSGTYPPPQSLGPAAGLPHQGSMISMGGGGSAVGGTFPTLGSSMSLASVHTERVVHRSPASRAVHEARTRFPDIFAPSRLLRGTGAGRGAPRGESGKRYDSNLFTGQNVPQTIRQPPGEKVTHPVTLQF